MSATQPNPDQPRATSFRESWRNWTRISTVRIVVQTVMFGLFLAFVFLTTFANLDAGEGIRTMFQTMDAAGLYPPIYLTRATTGKDQVLVILRNEDRPTVWNQICRFAHEHGTIGNAEVRSIMRTDDTLKASKALRRFVEAGLLVVANPGDAKQHRRYKLPERDLVGPLFSTKLGRHMNSMP